MSLESSHRSFVVFVKWAAFALPNQSWMGMANAVQFGIAMRTVRLHTRVTRRFVLRGHGVPSVCDINNMIIQCHINGAV